MCLNIGTTAQHKIAEHDITVYKVYIYDVKYGDFISPFHYFNMKINKCYTSDLTLDYSHGLFKAIKGFHSFTNIRDAIKLRDELKELNFSTPFTICKCIIPKGSKYFEGVFERYDDSSMLFIQYHSIASDNIMIVDRLDTKNPVLDNIKRWREMEKKQK